LKYAKYAVAVLLILAVIGAVIQLQREAIVRNLANAALSEQGIVATDLSIDSLGTDRIVLSKIVLEQADGTRFVIGGLSFPVNFSTARPESISIERLEIEFAAGSDRPAPFSLWLRSVLRLPDDIPDTTVTVSQLLMPGRPEIEEIRWYSSGQKQRLEFNVKAIEFAIDVDRTGADHHEVNILASMTGDLTSMSAALLVSRANGGFSLKGHSEFELAPWLPLFQAMNWIPVEIASLSGRLRSEIQFEIFDDETRSTPLRAEISFIDGMKAVYNLGDDSVLATSIGAAEPLRIAVEYPSLAWTVAGSIAINAEVEPFGDVAIEFRSLECRSGIVCTAHATARARGVDLDASHIGNASWTASATVALGEITQVTLAPGFELVLDDIVGADLSVASLMASANSSLQLQMDDKGWNGDIDHLNLTINGMSDNDDLLTSLLLSFEKLRIRDSGKTVDTELSMSHETAFLSVRDQDIVFPEMIGHLSLQNELLTSELDFSDAADSLVVKLNATHNFLTGQGSLSVENAMLDFGQGSLSTHLVSWPFPWNLSSGQLKTNLELDWQVDAKDLSYDGKFQAHIAAVAGNYGDIVFFGLNSDVAGRLDSSTGNTMSQSIASLELLEVGLPVQQIEVNFRFDLEARALHVNAASMSTLGGSVQADPFVFRIEDETNTITLRPQSIQLRFMTELAEFDDIELTGSISGALPITISDTSLTIENGRLESDSPGGVIRYLPGMIDKNADAPASNLDLVTRALGNFQFDSLSSDVDYSESGDLSLRMRLTGINPDMDELQPVILNLNIDNNIPQLLRSLQATRSIQEVLERKSAKPPPVLPQL